MSETHHRTVQRHCDVVVVGATDANLATALEHLNQGHGVIVIGQGEPSGAGADAVRARGGEILAAHVALMARDDAGAARVELTGGHSLVARVAIVATSGEVEQLQSSPLFSARQVDWDLRYSGEQVWSGNPNGTLVAEVQELPPGRALDVGAGEGGDAIWLAEHGWAVTAADISQRALDRIVAESAKRGLHITCLHADANQADAFPSESFDLVSAFYASLPRTATNTAITNLLAAVAPGGLLLVVNHDPAPMREPIDTTDHSRAYDTDAYVQIEHILDAIAASPEWSVEACEVRERPAGAVASSHHVQDVILRARRANT